MWFFGSFNPIYSRTRGERYFLTDPEPYPMYDFYNKWKENINFEELTAGLTHGDPGPGCNILLKDNTVSGIIDLINVQFNYYLADIGTFVMYGRLYLKENKDLLDRFIQFYLPNSPIDEKEIELLPFFILRRFLIQALYFGWRIRIGYTQG